MKRFLLITLILLAPVNVEASFLFFREKPSVIDQWLSAKGFAGTTYDKAMAYFKSLSGLNEGTIYDHLNHILTEEGYSGTMRDKLNSFFQSKMSMSNPRSAERKFWKDSSLDFGHDGGGYGEGGYGEGLYGGG